MDIYFKDDEIDKAMDDIVSDVVFDNYDRERVLEAPPAPAAPITTSTQNAFAIRRWV